MGCLLKLVKKNVRVLVVSIHVLYGESVGVPCIELGMVPAKPAERLFVKVHV